MGAILFLIKISKRSLVSEDDNETKYYNAKCCDCWCINLRFRNNPNAVLYFTSRWNYLINSKLFLIFSWKEIKLSHNLHKIKLGLVLMFDIETFWDFCIVIIIFFQSNVRCSKIVYVWAVHIILQTQAVRRTQKVWLNRQGFLLHLAEENHSLKNTEVPNRNYNVTSTFPHLTLPYPSVGIGSPFIGVNFYFLLNGK